MNSKDLIGFEFYIEDNSDIVIVRSIKDFTEYAGYNINDEYALGYAVASRANEIKISGGNSMTVSSKELNKDHPALLSLDKIHKRLLKLEKKVNGGQNE